jgi:hypothetical protein
MLRRKLLVYSVPLSILAATLQMSRIWSASTHHRGINAYVNSRKCGYKDVDCKLVNGEARLQDIAPPSPPLRFSTDVSLFRTPSTMHHTRTEISRALKNLYQSPALDGGKSSFWAPHLRLTAVLPRLLSRSTHKRTFPDADYTL